MKLYGKKEYMSLPVRASLWYTVCNVVNKSIALLSTPVFTRLLTEEQYGTFAVFQSWYSILIIFTSLNVFLGGYQKGLILFNEDIKRFTSAQLGLTTTITIICFTIYILNVDFWSKVFDLPPHLMIAMFFELLFMPALELWSSQQRFYFKYKKFVFLTLIMTTISLIGGVIAVYFSSHKLEARVYTDIFAKLLFAGAIFIYLFLSGRSFFSKKYWKYALKFNFPLLPHYLSNYILNQSDRVMIGKMVGNTEAAYYSVAYTISTMMLLITSAINNSLTPYTYKALDSNNEKNIEKSTKPVIILVAVLCFITMAFAPEIIGVFAGKQYLDAIYVIPPIAASVFFIFLYSLFSNIEYYFQKTKFIAAATCLSAASNLILNYIFIRLFGYYAAGYTTLVCYIFLSFLHYVFYKKTLILQNKKDIYDIKLIILLSIVVVSGMIAMVMMYNFIVIRYLFIIIIVALMWMFRNKIKILTIEFGKIKK